MSKQTYAVATATDLNAAIAAIDAASQSSGGSGTAYVVQLAAGATLQETQDLAAVNLMSGDSLTINGEGATLDGGGLYRGLFAYAGTVTINDLTIQNAVARGGNGAGGGGGGAGLGGGLFVANNSADGVLRAQVVWDCPDLVDS